MIEKADWEAVYRELAATSRHRGRNRTGAASAAESAAEAAAADEAFLACHPEVARALLAPLEVPYQGRPGDPDYLTAAELEQNWAALQERLDEKGHAAVEGGEQSQVAGKPVIEHVPEAPLAPPRWQPQTAPPPLRGWQLAAAAAALVATVAVGLYWRAEQTARRLTIELSQPRVGLEERLLLPDGQRGGNRQPPIPLPPEAEYYLLVPALVHHPRYPDYRLEILAVDRQPPHRLWEHSGLQRRGDDTFEVLVPRSFLAPGTYRLVLEGIDDTGRHPLASYTVRVAAE